MIPQFLVLNAGTSSLKLLNFKVSKEQELTMMHTGQMKVYLQHRL